MKEKDNKKEEKKKEEIHPRWTDNAIQSVSKPTAKEKQRLTNEMYAQIARFLQQ